MAKTNHKQAQARIKTQTTQRIAALDLLRGFFLVVILINHIELYPNFFDLFSGKGRLWVSAAEGFFFISGLLIGMVYKRRLHLGMKFIFKKMWARAAQIYAAGVGFTFLYLSWVIFTNHTPVKDSLPSPFPWGRYIVEALTMRFTYGWADFLVRFAILMFFAPIVFYIIAKGRWWLALALIWAVWLFRGQSFSWSWQLIFNLGILIGYYWQAIQNRFHQLKPHQRTLITRSLLTVALASFTFSYSSVYGLSWLYQMWGTNNLSPAWQHVAFTWAWVNHDIWNWADKWTMGPLRIVLFFIWFPVLFAAVRRYERLIGSVSRGVLELLGRNSLFVYSVQSLIVFIFKMYVIPPTTTFLQNFIITAISLVILILITKLYIRLQPSLGAISLPKLNWRAGKSPD